MKHTGKLPRAVVGEIHHVINNALNVIVMSAELYVPPVNREIILRQAKIISEYVKSLDDKDDFNFPSEVK
jgi:hypothetical protein